MDKPTESRGAAGPIPNPLESGATEVAPGSAHAPRGWLVGQAPITFAVDLSKPPYAPSVDVSPSTSEGNQTGLLPIEWVVSEEDRFFVPLVNCMIDLPVGESSMLFLETSAFQEGPWTFVDPEGAFGAEATKDQDHDSLQTYTEDADER